MKLNNPEAERAILGTLLSDPFALVGSLELSVPDFADMAYGRLFGTVVSVVKRNGDATDLASIIAAHAERRGLAENVEIKVTGQLTRQEIADLRTETSADPVALAKIIRTASTLRHSRRMAQEFAGKCEEWDGEGDYREILDSHISQIQRLNQQGLDTRTMLIGEATTAGRQRSRDRAAGLLPPSLSFPLPKMTSLIGELDMRTLSIIAGRPGHGKTQLACQCARHIAETQGITTAIASLEMDSGVLGRRLISSMTGIPQATIKAGACNEDQEYRLDRANAVMDRWPLWIADRVQKDVQSILRWMRQVQSDHGVRVFIVDYVQIMSDLEEKRDTSEANRLGKMCAGLRSFVDSSDSAVIVLSQVNRSVNQRKKDDRLPGIGDLYGGGLEAVADLIITLWRPAEDDASKKGGDIEPAKIGIVKNREGQTGLIECGWKTDTAEFVNHTEKELPGGQTGF